MYTIKLTPHAKKQVDELSDETKIEIKKRINYIKANPYYYVEKLKVLIKYPIYSLIVGEYRIIMSIKNIEIIVFEINYLCRK